ncbi:MAG: hypothetical protein IPP58_10165 [Holophagaceae bacterium]|uniref:YCII-related domain-containing protein n=1 Tax=Candidatus Geothrix skivensis TaxID=2954439 RepID=A0A9D7SIH5_9BACT|nr:hypothetical protein [Candidatus Geothrix skivensis]
MQLVTTARMTFLAVSLTVWISGVAGQPLSPAPAIQELPLFAVEIKTGPKWDQTKPPQDQAYFREHSANLKRLRDSGSLIMGARYSDKGLVVLAAQNEAQARAMMDEDPSVKAEVFRYELHPFNVFYPGTVYSKPKRSERP